MDLRKYGRSILPNQNPFFCKSLKEYFADLDTALAIIREEGNDKILLMAHSTGGLITPYYLDSKKGKLPQLFLKKIVIVAMYIQDCLFGLR